MTRREASPLFPAMSIMAFAAVARANGASVVTRDIRGFEECGVAVIKPAEAA